jgi:hypothetical protein
MELAEPQLLPVDIVELHSGTLLGFKAAPGSSCEKLFAHALSVSDAGESPTPDWSGIYVQLTMEQAVNYLPNQFDRGEVEACIVSLRVREGQSLRVVVYKDRRMSHHAVSSAEKARLVRDHVLRSVAPDLSAAPLLMALGEQRLALCLVDCDDYELAVPHALFSDKVLTAEPVLRFWESPKVPGCIGRVAGLPSTSSAVDAVSASMSKGQLSDASLLGRMLSVSLREIGHQTDATWRAQ